jgi:hypothetical protein
LGKGPYPYLSKDADSSRYILGLTRDAFSEFVSKMAIRKMRMLRVRDSMLALGPLKDYGFWERTFSPRTPILQKL